MAPRHKRPSVSQIRTASSIRGAADNATHKKFMRLCSLEMLRSRLDQTRQVAMRQIAECESRCAAIEKEISELMAVIERERGGKPLTRETTAPTQEPDEPFSHSY